MSLSTVAFWLHAVLLAGAAVSGFTASAAESTVVPLTRAHAHNDYEHSRPLLDALERGFCSVEADIYLVDGALLVAHDLTQARLERTLQALYLDPLRQRVQVNHGRVFPNGPVFHLMIDFKSEPGATYATLRPVLEQYRSMLTVFRADRMETNAVTVILSGNRPVEVLSGEPVRLAGLDGRLADLERNPPRMLFPWVSDNWRNLFTWRGQGPFPDSERVVLEGYVRQAKTQGRQLRFWAAPDTPEGWRVLSSAGVDLINTDRLEELAAFLKDPASGAANPGL